MKINELIKHLKKHQCEFHRQGGSHEVWIHQVTGKKFALPRHKTIIVGLAEKICKQIGVAVIGKEC